MKKTDSNKGGPGLFIKGQRGRSKDRGPKRDSEATISFSCYFCKKLGHIKKNYIKHKEMLKRKDGKNSDEASTSEKSCQVRVVKEANEDSCDVFTTELGKGKYSDA